MATQFETYFNILIRDVPSSSIIEDLVKTFMNSAKIDMGCDYEDATFNRVVYIIKNEFSYLPVCFIASGFSQGAMGKYGAGRLVPRTIHGWLTEVCIEYNRKIAHDNVTSEGVYNDCADLHTYPLGSAIMKKLEWFNIEGNYHINDWDKIPLKNLSERIKQGLETTPEIYGVKRIRQ